jgi:hypothetical protein
MLLPVLLINTQGSASCCGTWYKGRTRYVCLVLQVASQTNTPLVSQAVSSAMVARGLLADKAERDALLALPGSSKPRTAVQTGEHVVVAGSSSNTCSVGGNT